MDITLGYPRFTFGVMALLDGFSFIPAMIGMFGMAEIMRNVVVHESKIGPIAVQAGNIFKGMFDLIRQYWRHIVRSGLLGTAIGILPGAGADIAAWVTYGVSRRFSKEPEKYGKGHIEGIINATTANNASLGGAWVPALVFGIPGDSITAIIIGVLYMKNLRPGPGIFERSPEIIYAVYLTFILANLLLIPFGWAAIKIVTKVLRVPRNLLYPVILIFCSVGAYSINNTNFDVFVMLCLGILAYFMEMNGIPVAPAILGMVLGNLLEESFMQSMMKVEWNLLAFFSRPISAFLGCLVFAVWLSPLLVGMIKKRLAQA
jgi:TctA family transporter